LFPTETVVEPPLQLSPAGTATPRPSPGPCPSSPPASDTPGPAPCPGLEGSPSGTAPVTVPDAGPGPSTPAPPTRFAQPVLVYQRRARTAPPPPSPPVAPSSPGSPPTTSGFSAGDADTAAAAPSCPCRDAGVPPTASSPTPTSCSPYGDATRGWDPAAPGSCGDARRLAGLSSTLFRPRGLVGPSLAPRDGRGVCGAPRQPDMGSSAPSTKAPTSSPASGSGHTSAGLMALSRGTKLAGFSGASLSALVSTMMRPSAQW
jgi:hypothetical protein